MNDALNKQEGPGVSAGPHSFPASGFLLPASCFGTVQAHHEASIPKSFRFIDFAARPC
jgi:hypothetical protein